MAKKKSLKKKIIVNAVIILVFAALAYVYLSRSKVITPEAIRGVKAEYFFFVAAFYLAVFLLLSLIEFLVYRTFTRAMPYGRCVLSVLLGNLGSSVTPFKSGHFPLMAYYQNNAGVPFSDTVTGCVKCQIVYSVTSIIVYTAIVITLAVKALTIDFSGTTVALWVVVATGLGFHLIVFIAVVILAYNYKLQRFAVTLWAKILKKIKRIESVEEYFKEKTEKLALYKEQMNNILKRFYAYIPVCLLYACYMVLQGGTQYLSYLLISGNAFCFADMSVFYVLCLTSAYIGNVIPVPGGVGTTEVIFTLVYAAVIPESLLGSTLVLWRFSTYYVFVIAEILVLAITLSVKKKGGTPERKATLTENFDEKSDNNGKV